MIKLICERQGTSYLSSSHNLPSVNKTHSADLYMVVGTYIITAFNISDWFSAMFWTQQENLHSTKRDVPQVELKSRFSVFEIRKWNMRRQRQSSIVYISQSNTRQFLSILHKVIRRVVSIIKWWLCFSYKDQLEELLCTVPFLVDKSEHMRQLRFCFMARDSQL